MEHFSLEFDTVEKGMIRRAAAARRPINGTLELTPLCNMNCGMCYIRLSREEMERQGRMRTAQEWIQLAKQMEQAGVLYLLLTGGEPLLFPDFQALYLRLKEMGMILTVNTNGTLINEEWAKFFGAHKPRRVNITLYGADDGAYETLCHYPGGFSKTVEAIGLLKEHGVAVKINGSVTRENRDDMEAIYRLGRELDAPVHMDTYMLPGLRQRHLPCEKQSRLSPEDAAQAELESHGAEMDSSSFMVYVEWKREELKRQEELARRMEDAGQRETEPVKTPYSNGFFCQAGSCSFAVNWQGFLRPCVTMEEPSIPVFETGFDAAWRQLTKEVSAITFCGGCAICSLRPVCKICAASARLETGAYDGVPEYLCRYAQAYRQLLFRDDEMG